MSTPALPPKPKLDEGPEYPARTTRRWSSAPIWAWPFGGACVLIPILTQGGAIPSAIGLGGMLGCCVVAWDASKSRARRLGICAAISAGCWIAFLVFLGVRMLLASRTG